MVSNSFRLSRQQIAKIVGNDPEAIKQFEKLFSVNQEYFQSGEVDSTIIEAGSAGATATQALSEAALLDDRVQALELGPPDISLGLIADVQQEIDSGTFGSSTLILVDEKSDLPSASGGVITLADNYTYFFTTTVDLTGDRIVAGQNTTIIGGSSENCRIKSTGLVGTALISSAWSLPMRNITIEASTALNLDATGNPNQALDWFGVNFTDCTTIGTIKNYNNVIWTDCGVLNSAGLTFDGTTGTIGLNSCIFDGRSASTTITIPSTATITRRFRIIYSAFVVLSGETGINVNSSATVPVEGYILDTVNFSGGGTYTTGVTYSDNKALFVACRGVTNSASTGFMTMQANATATTVAATSTYYKVAGTTTLEAISQKFSHSSNRLTYDGAITRDFRVTVTATATSGNNNEIGMRIAKNGTTLTNSTGITTTSGTGKAENAISQSVVQLATNDYVEIFVSNETATNNITVTYLSVIVEALN